MTDLDPRPYDVSLFDAPPTLGTHRKADRPTSVAAARSVQPGPDQQRCLEAFALAGGTATIDSVCEHFEVLGIRRDRGSLSRRLTDLADAGFIRDSGEVVRGSRGRDVTVWRVDGHVCDNSGCEVEANERGRQERGS